MPAAKKTPAKKTDNKSTWGPFDKTAQITTHINDMTLLAGHVATYDPATGQVTVAPAPKTAKVRTLVTDILGRAITPTNEGLTWVVPDTAADTAAEPE